MGLVTRRGAFLLSGTIAAGIYGSMAMAADVDVKTNLPAVSGPNGKVEISGGYIDINDLDDDGIVRAAASFSFPVGDMFGLQADIGVTNAFGDTSFGGNLHAFTRDPDRYLFGVIGGFADFETANLWYVGPEVELYVDNISIELLGGYLNVDPVGGGSLDKAFFIGDLALYATDNVRLTLGGRSIGGFESAHAGLEWHMADYNLPASFTLDGRIGENGFASIMAGFSVYFGGEQKSLIRRHREDDPHNRTLDIFAGTANGAAFLTGTASSSPPPPPPEVPPPPPEVPPPPPEVPPPPPEVPPPPPEVPPPPPEVPPPPPEVPPPPPPEVPPPPPPEMPPPPPPEVPPPPPPEVPPPPPPPPYYM